MNPVKKQILAARKGKKRVENAYWMTHVHTQEALKENEYVLYWRVDAEEVVYIEKKRVIRGDMTERVFDTIDSAQFKRHL